MVLYATLHYTYVLFYVLLFKVCIGQFANKALGKGTFPKTKDYSNDTELRKYRQPLCGP